jgi:hypothetical protein
MNHSFARSVVHISTAAIGELAHQGQGERSCPKGNTPPLVSKATLSTLAEALVLFAVARFAPRDFCYVTRARKPSDACLGVPHCLPSQATQLLRYLRWLGSVTTGFPTCRWRKIAHCAVFLVPLPRKETKTGK